ncbi:FAD binding domain-containing protein [Pisolithus orientalis]|uniref:FAD binding domain-containing protein n=1 Tax=Pisolithus orientalis TaxID=936130 RepID=UPI002224D29D|nr:FAD binding domain-containing protein [Pisolithus orientalis]KAI6008117.1 FAD binding domain-containing protein [Pisolithus orientalis]
MSPYTEPTPAIPYYNPKLMGQNTLEAILREHLAKFGCTIELGTRLVSFTQDDKCVRAKIVKHRADDGEELEEEMEAAYLVGADGARGVTRKQLELAFVGSTLRENHVVLGDIRLEVKGLDREYWHYFGTMSQDMISLRPTDELGKDGYQILIGSHVRDMKGLPQDEEALLNCIKDFIGLGDDVNVKEVMWVSEFRPNMRMVNKFGVGRAFVAGGANSCPVHSPTGGQGLNTSVQDAFNLAWKLALVYKGLSPASLLDTYTTERLPVITEMLGLTIEILKLTFGESKATDAQISADGSDNTKKVKSNLERAMHRGKNMYMLGVNYRTSPIVVDEFAPVSILGVAVVHSAYGSIQEGVLRAGDRAPDAPGLLPVLQTGGPGITRLFDIFAPMYHTVLIFAPALVVPVVLSVLATLKQGVPNNGLVRPLIVLPGRPFDLDGGVETLSVQDQAAGAEIVVDQAGHAYRGYVIEKDKSKVIVVRPDGVVGAIARGTEGLGRYLEGVFGEKRGVGGEVEVM